MRPDAKPPSESQTPAPRRKRRLVLFGVQDRLLLSLSCLVIAVVLITSVIVAEHTSQAFMSLATTNDVEAIPATKAQVLREIFGVAFASLAILLPLVYVLVSRAFLPLRKLTIASRGVAAGRFETVDIQFRGEAMAELAETFNNMVVRLREQKQLADDATARLLETNLNLERLVAERTREAEGTSKRLREEIAEKSDFLRAVSHDLNAPLRNIDGMAASILRKHGETLTDDAKQRLERIRTNVEAESELIGEVLELSRIRSIRGEFENVRLNDLVWSLRGVFEQDLRDKNIELALESNLPTIHVEKNRIRQVFQNLFDNAIKYMGDGPERVIRVSSKPVDDGIEIAVSDTGIGISAEDAARVFYAFRRGSNHQGVAGKGVGLAGVKAIIETYDGAIRCEPGMRGGTTFRFTIGNAYIGAKTTTPQPDEGTIVADEDAVHDDPPRSTIAVEPHSSKPLAA
ncbi:MAG: HAMP domain-containing sensor histidine kinase [Planctomycetota bacterium]